MTVKEELDFIASKHRGTIKPEDVVSFARNPKTSLHSHFTWNDGEAATAHRLWQARQVIRVHVVTIEGTNENVRAFVSLKSDRGVRGYRRTVDVLSDEELRNTLLSEAKDEMQSFVKKYKTLNELTPVIRAMNRLMSGSQKQSATAFGAA